MFSLIIIKIEPKNFTRKMINKRKGNKNLLHNVSREINALKEIRSTLSKV